MPSYRSCTCTSRNVTIAWHRGAGNAPQTGSLLLSDLRFKRLVQVRIPGICRILNQLKLLFPLYQFWRTGGHFACACVNPLNNNSVDASNLMAGNRKLARKVAGLLKAISLVLWIPYFPTIGRFLRGFSLLDFSAVGFLGLLKTFKTQRQKVMFLYKSDFHCKAMHFYGLISELVVLLIREEMHRSNVQLLN